MRGGLVRVLVAGHARRAARDVAPHLIGRRVLDLGAGEALVGAALRRLVPGRWFCAADLGPFGTAPGPYVVCDGARLPFPDAAFDTTLILLTLHHCAQPERVLDEAVRVTRARLVVTESVYRNRVDRFWLDLLDARLNGRRHGGEMPAASAFRPAAAWRALFESRGLAVAATAWLGPAWERLVHHPLLFVLDIPSARAAARAPEPAWRRS
jgi:SAM-dependent methyltransferase